MPDISDLLTAAWNASPAGDIVALGRAERDAMGRLAAAQHAHRLASDALYDARDGEDLRVIINFLRHGAHSLGRDAGLRAAAFVVGRDKSAAAKTAALGMGLIELRDAHDVPKIEGYTPKDYDLTERGQIIRRALLDVIAEATP